MKYNFYDLKKMVPTSSSIFLEATRNYMFVLISAESLNWLEYTQPSQPTEWQRGALKPSRQHKVAIHTLAVKFDVFFFLATLPAYPSLSAWCACTHIEAL